MPLASSHLDRPDPSLRPPPTMPFTTPSPDASYGPPGSLTRGWLLQEKRITSEVAALERDTGFKLRVLAQNYPETPGEELGWGGARNLGFLP